jgi:polyvinyl alcohol dehydrogenase (cytochrome)
LYGPSGAAIWASPTIDIKRRLIYVVTGNSYTDLDVKTSDAVVALRLDNGRIVWANQLWPGDNFRRYCPTGANCEEKSGLDFDFGSSPILRNVDRQRDILLVAQKSGIVYGLDPAKKGQLLWQTRIGAGGILGGVQWGPAADDHQIYAAVSDLSRIEVGPQSESYAVPTVDGTPGLYAINLASGSIVWSKRTPIVNCASHLHCLQAQSAAVSVVPGAVFSGAIDGHFRAYATSTGEVLWDFDTTAQFRTVNGVVAQGGSIDGAGPTIANGIVITNSGYFLNGVGNVLLAFSVYH